jgi:hypothetical protein
MSQDETSRAGSSNGGAHSSFTVLIQASRCLPLQPTEQERWAGKRDDENEAQALEKNRKPDKPARAMVGNGALAEGPERASERGSTVMAPRPRRADAGDRIGPLVDGSGETCTRRTKFFSIQGSFSI